MIYCFDAKQGFPLLAKYLGKDECPFLFLIAVQVSVVRFPGEANVTLLFFSRKKITTAEKKRVNPGELIGLLR